jgi:hypothetical protein
LTNIILTQQVMPTAADDGTITAMPVRCTTQRPTIASAPLDALSLIPASGLLGSKLNRISKSHPLLIAQATSTDDHSPIDAQHQALSSGWIRHP